MFSKKISYYKNIVFTNAYNNHEYPPEPAYKNVPDWYKNTLSYMGDINKAEHGLNPGTIKKCIPVFDAITAGYIIFTQVDIKISRAEDGAIFYSWPLQDAIDFHPISQAPLHPLANNNPYPKIMNPWIIETDPGYSCLFINPMHNPNQYFTIMPGIVDTDKYNARVNFPFTLNDLNWNGVIPAGTAVAQVIPFKRDSWKSKIGGQDDIIKESKIMHKLKSKIYNSYKQNFWSKKEYR